jgi:hypothetical protein
MRCTKCRAPLRPDSFQENSLSACPVCHSRLVAYAFPALLAGIAKGSKAAAAEESEATCFYHPAKRAVRPCDGCGRFLCALCDIDFNGSHLCPGCLEKDRTSGREDLVQRRTLYDTLALYLSLLPLLMWPVTFVTAPAALYFVIRHWKTPGSLIKRTKIRFILAALFATAQIAGWIVVAIYILSELGTVS